MGLSANDLERQFYIEALQLDPDTEYSIQDLKQRYLTGGGLNAAYAGKADDGFVDEDIMPIRHVTPAPFYRSYTPLFRETFGQTARWVSDGNSSVANDAVNYSAAGIDRREGGAWVTTSGKSLKLTKTSTTTTDGQATATLASPININGHHPVMRFYVHDGSGSASPSALTAVILMVFDGAGKWAYWSDTGTGLATNRYRAGWRTVPFRGSVPQATSAGFDPTNVTKIRLWIQTAGNNAATPSVTFDWLDLMPVLPSPVPYLLTFDGAYANHKDALAYMAARGMKASIYATYDEIGNVGRMTMDDLRQAQFMGHYIDIHERNTLPTGWFNMTDAEKRQSILEGQAWKRANGFNGGGFATLATQWYSDQDTLETMLPYLDHVRIGAINNQVLWNPRMIGVAWDTNSMSAPADETTHRTNAKAQGTICAGVVHDMTGAFDLADFRTMIDNIAADAGVRVVTPDVLLSTDWYA